MASTANKEKVRDRPSVSLSSLTTPAQGNAAFKAGKYAEAVGHYTAAAQADPSDATFFLNRAAAYLKLAKYVSPSSNIPIIFRETTVGMKTPSATAPPSSASPGRT
jgi:hypothetical protein